MLLARLSPALLLGKQVRHRRVLAVQPGQLLGGVHRIELSDADGLKVDGSEVVYAPFGEIREGDLSDLTDFGFTGQQLDRSTGGLMYYGARYYLPELRRFISADTIIPGAANPQAFNRYAYTLNNPIKYVDPSGHGAEICGTDLNCWNHAWYKAHKHGGGGGNQPQPEDPLPPLIPEEVQEFVEKTTKGLADIFRPQEDVGSAAAEKQDIDEDSSFAEKAAEELAQSLGENSAECLFVGGGPGPGAGGMAACLFGGEGRNQKEKLPDAEYLDLDDLDRMLDDTLDPCDFASFDEDTVVTTEDGLVPIGELEEGDYVLAYDEETGELGYYPVEAVHVHLDPIIVYLTIDGEVVETTPEHPFYTAAGQWRLAGDLRAGNTLWQADGSPGIVQATLRVFDARLMYNLTVSTAHTFFVGEEQSLVHNCPRGGPRRGRTGGPVEFSDEERALQVMVDDLTNYGNKPLSEDDALAAYQLAEEIGYRGYGAKLDDISGNHWQRPHMHLEGAGKGGHVPVTVGKDLIDYLRQAGEIP